jgi:hypothetical protein
LDRHRLIGLPPDDCSGWTDVTATVTLIEGVQSMRFVVDAAGPASVVGHLNYIRLESTGVTASGAAPHQACRKAFAGFDRASPPTCTSSKTSSWRKG